MKVKASMNPSLSHSPFSELTCTENSAFNTRAFWGGGFHIQPITEAKESKELENPGELGMGVRQEDGYDSLTSF